MNVLLIVAGGMTVFSYWIRSSFCQVISGLVLIAAGIKWISTDAGEWSILIGGMAFVAFGLYSMIMVGIDLLKGD